MKLKRPQAEPALTLVVKPEAYFHELVTEAMGQQKIKAQPETEFYLVKLLNRFMTTDSLFPRDENGHLREEPLALMIKEAIETPEPRVQSALFRHIGDVSLYMAGFFQQSLSRKLVDLDYYIGMGGTAYQRVASRSEEDVLKAIYLELSEKFSRFVDVLAQVSDKTSVKSEKDLLKMYEHWVQTGSERAAKVLQEAGIMPNSNVKKEWQ